MPGIGIGFKEFYLGMRGHGITVGQLGRSAGSVFAMMINPPLKKEGIYLTRLHFPAPARAFRATAGNFALTSAETSGGLSLRMSGFFPVPDSEGSSHSLYAVAI